MKRRMVKEDQGWGIRDLLNLALAGDDPAGESQGTDREAEGLSKREPASQWYRDAVDSLKADRLWEALLGFAAVVHADPAHVKAWNNLGVILYEWGLTEQARRAFEMVLQLEPEHALAMENLKALREESF